MAISREDLSSLAEVVGKAVREYVELALSPLRERLASLADASRVAEIESRQAALEKRLAQNEARAESHLRHLKNLEARVKGEPVERST